MAELENVVGLRQVFPMHPKVDDTEVDIDTEEKRLNFEDRVMLAVEMKKKRRRQSQQHKCAPRTVAQLETSQGVASL